MKLAHVFLFVAIGANISQGARILGLFSHTGKSHHMVFEPLLLRLAERGHQMTVVSFFPQSNAAPNYTDVSLEGIARIGLETFDVNYLEPGPIVRMLPLQLRRMITTTTEFHALSDMALDTCKRLVNWPELDRTLRREYDLIIVENFNSDCMLGLTDIYGNKAPIVALSSCNILPWSSDRMGIEDNPAYVPTLPSRFTSRMTFLERIENTFYLHYFKYWFRNYIQAKEEDIIEKAFGRKVDLQKLAASYSLFLVNTFPAFNGVRPSVPGIIEVGGMHLSPKRKPIPAFMEKFINESEHGVVLVSFGSLIRTSTIPKPKEEIIMKALGRLKQRVIWKYEESGDEGTLIGNVLRVKWIPQYDLLRNDKVLAFVAHGGLLGMTEAVSSGKPMVVMPFYGDQWTNAAAAAEAGFAKVLVYADLTEDALCEALQFVLSAQTRLRARKVSDMWNDRPAPPMETAVYWVERIIRWGNDSPLYSVSREMPVYQLMLLDVYLAYLVALFVTIAIVWCTIKSVFRLISRGFRKDKQKLN